MGQLATDIYNEAARQIPTAPVTDPADLVTGDKLMNVFSVVSQAIEVLELLTRGARILRVVGQPNDVTDGEDGDLALDIRTTDLYAKDGGAWSVLFRLKGNKGEKGKDGDAGPSAYDVALQQGYVGSVDQWLASLGVQGDAGPSAYDVAVQQGFQGNVTQWLASLGVKGDDGADGSDTYHESFAPTAAYPGRPGDTFYWHVSKTQYAIYDYPNVLLAAGANPWRERFATPEAATGSNPGTGYTLPAATAANLGGVKVGTGLAVAADGTISTAEPTQEEYPLFATFAAMNVYPTASRRVGLPGRVTSDPDATKNGTYTVAADGYSWVHDGTGAGVTALASGVAVVVGRYYEFTLASPRLWKAKQAQTPVAVLPQESDSQVPGGSYWVEVSRAGATAAAGGPYATLDSTGKVPASQLPTTIAEFGVILPAPGAQTLDVFIDTSRMVGTISLTQISPAMVDVVYKLNNAVVSLPVAVVLFDKFTVSATCPSTGGQFLFNIS